MKLRLILITVLVLNCLICQGGAMELTSTAFKPDGPIPAEHAYHGKNLSPPLTITGVPAGTASLALVCNDPDAPRGNWIHWVVWNLDPQTTHIAAGQLPAKAVVGANSWGKALWGGPAPPSGTHHYVFKLYALKLAPALKPGAEAKALAAAMQGIILAEAKLVGTYQAEK